MPPTNSAAWLPSAKAKPLVVKPAAYVPPLANELVVKNGAVAINPVDWGLQTMAFMPLHYPAVLGFDLAGEVVEVGSAVSSDFRVGDRVLGSALSYSTERSEESEKHCEGAFQTYTVLQARMTSRIPSDVSFEQAAVLPLCLSTAACGLFSKGYLELQHPSVNPPQPAGKTVLVWGGATCVGSNAIQLGVAAGYDVITTASPKNFDYVKKLGARQAFDYNSKSIVDELVAAQEGKTLAGVLDSITINGVFEACAEVLLRTDSNKFIAAAMRLPEKIPDGIRAEFIAVWPVFKQSAFSKEIFNGFLPQALAEGKYVAAPDPHVVGKGLECVQDAIDLWRKGVSATKMVVSL
ncbi:hypothetical protein MMC20_001660 [Loxospora ochrophaea]|nr:hypothetical protein [Loxospora ochrophaea]